MIAALYVEKDGCYFGIEGCYFHVPGIVYSHAAQRPECCQGLSSCVSGETSRTCESAHCAMAQRKSRPQCGKCKTLAEKEPGQGGPISSCVSDCKSRACAPVSASLARAHRLQSKASRAWRQWSPAVKAVWFDSSSIRRIVGCAGRRVCDLLQNRPRYEECKAPLHRSLSQQQSCSGASLPGLQYNAWVRSGQSGTSAERSAVS